MLCCVIVFCGGCGFPLLYVSCVCNYFGVDVFCFLMCFCVFVYALGCVCLLGGFGKMCLDVCLMCCCAIARLWLL